MPSFDVVSEVDMHELSNAVDQANREVGNRFDFKGVDAKFTIADSVITVSAEVDFQLHQMMDILQNKLVKRGIDIACLKQGDVVESGQRATMPVTVQQGIESDLARKIVRRGNVKMSVVDYPLAPEYNYKKTTEKRWSITKDTKQSMIVFFAFKRTKPSMGI